MVFVDRLMHHRLTALICMLLIISSVRGQSVLATGDWYKVGVTTSGIYKLDRSFLSNLGLQVSTLDPRTIKVYGNGGGGMLPQSNNEPRPFDLVQNPIFAVGETDGSMDTGDYFLFYGQNPDKIEWTENGPVYEQNIYSDTTYYFIAFGNGDAQRITSRPSETTQASIISEFDDVIIHELEDRNILRSGRIWLGENMSPAAGLTRTFDFNVDNVTSFESISLTGVSQSQEACSIDILINGSQSGSLPLDPIPFGPGSTYSPKGRSNSAIFDLTGSSDQIEVRFQFNPNGGTSISYIDHFELHLKRYLSIVGNELSFRSISSINDPISTFEVEGMGSSDQIWDVTDPVAPVSVEFSHSGTKATFSATSDIIREFVAIKGANHPAPKSFGQVPNQDLKANTAIDAIIIAHPNFLAAANELADFHRSHDNFDIAVVTPRQIYNEFSSGMQDVSALRDYVKYVYDEGQQLKYLLLFGDASFAYKNPDFQNTNFVPIYQSRESFSPIFSHSSDDYFGFLEDDEGEWFESSQGDHTMEIGVGRIPAKTTAEAQVAVNKIIRYSTRVEALGKWRTDFVYVADDGDANIHVQQADDLSLTIEEESNFNTRKLYLDAFEQEVSPSRERSPELKRKIVESINKGALFLNFLGHGSEEVWMDENVLIPSTVEELRNYQRLPIIVTATCEFGRYDDPFQFSGAERLLLFDQGAVALLTTTRPVFAHTNFILNQAYHASVLEAADDVTMRLGDIIRQTKNEGLQGPVNRNFALLGDPMLRPAYPNLKIELDQFTEAEPETLSALELVTISGSIVDGEQIRDDFSGTIELELFDIPVQKITKGQQSAPHSYQERDNALYRGKATVSNGAFSHQFRLPRSISYKNQPGKLVLYAASETLEIDAGGGSKNILIGGTDQTAPEDTSPPDLQVYLNEPSFTNGSKVGSGAMLIAKFSDESGINISSSGFDRGITLELGEEIIELNEFYTSDLDDHTKGTVLYPLSELEPGKYLATIKGSDTHNNPVERSVEFVVSDQPILQTYNFNTYPNPTRDFVNFSFEHDREGEPLQVDLILYALNGEQSVVSRQEIDFSLRNETVTFDWSDKRIMDGIYAYKLSIRSLSDGAQAEQFGRLVIRN